MTAYSILFWDSFYGMLIISLSGETSWFAARDFGVYNIVSVTAVCYIASVLALTFNTVLGYGISCMNGKLFSVDEELYEELREKASKYGIYIFLFQMLPFIKIFYLFAGMFRLPLKKLILITLAGRAFYYLYYLYIYPVIPSF